MKVGDMETSKDMVSRKERKITVKIVRFWDTEEFLVESQTENTLSI